MRYLFRSLLLLPALLLAGPATAAVLWVGNSANCVGSNVFPSLTQALFVAAFNSDSSNEIRLTNTVSYTGNTNGNYTLTNWTAGGAGSLTLAGGYSNCFVAAPTILTSIGQTANPIFTINTTTQAFSEITLKHLLLHSSQSRAIIARSGAIVTLENVVIFGNNGGIAVEANGFVDVNSASRIELGGGGVTVNGLVGNVTHGGGIHCSGANASIRMAGDMYYNGALQAGGHIYVGNGCFVELLDGVRIRGSANPAAGDPPPLNPDAPNGGAIYVAAGGQLHARGGANRVIIHDLKSSSGAGLHINGGLAILENTHMDNNEAAEGAAITVTNGGQLFMDRTASCLLGGLRCSEIQNSRHSGNVVFVNNNGFAQIQRTLIERSVYSNPSGPIIATGLAVSYGGSELRLNRVGFIDNEAYSVLSSNPPVAGSGTGSHVIAASHLTVAKNRLANAAGDSYFSVNRGLSAASFRTENSVITDTQGTDWFGGVFGGKCNLIDEASDTHGGSVWPAGSYTVGAPVFVNIAVNDPHQLPQSNGVDMCQRDTFAWSTEIDIDMQSAPVNEMTNPQGLPGETGGLYDAGFDEVYANVGEDEFTLTIQKQGTGSGAVISVPGGISCGADCSEVYFNGTVVILNAVPSSGSSFIGWFNCPLVNQSNQCLVNMTTNHTIRAEFAVQSDAIFSNGFE